VVDKCLLANRHEGDHGEDGDEDAVGNASSAGFLRFCGVAVDGGDGFDEVLAFFVFHGGGSYNRESSIDESPPIAFLLPCGAVGGFDWAVS